MIRVMYDSQILMQPIIGGIARYFVELIKEYNSKNSLIEPLLAVQRSDNPIMKEFANVSVKPCRNVDSFLGGINFKGKASLYNILYYARLLPNDTRSHLRLGRRLNRKDKYDILHPTYYEPQFFKLKKKRPIVLTVYDLTHELLPEFFSPENLTFEWKSKAIENADHIIAISQNTKNDLLHFYKIPEKKISVIYLASSLELNKSNTTENPNTYPYILYIGNRQFYKNFYTLGKAFVQLSKKFPDLHLVCVGGGQFKSQEINWFKYLGVKSKVHQVSANDKQLISYLNHSRAFIFPSYYEGFGIPLVEAFQCKAPVICSKGSSFQEVAGDAAAYFDPQSETDIAKVIEKIIGSEEKRSSMIEAGLKRAEIYSWHKTASQTASLYQKLV